MPHNKDPILEDIRNAIAELKQFTQDKTRKDLGADRGLQLILERGFKSLGKHSTA